MEFLKQSKTCRLVGWTLGELTVLVLALLCTCALGFFIGEACLHSGALESPSGEAL